MTPARKLQDLIDDLTGPDNRPERTADGRFIVSAAANPAVVISIEAEEAPERVLLQAALGTLPAHDVARMARAALSMSAASAAQGGPAVGLDPDSNTLLAVRCIALGTDSGQFGEADAIFAAQAVELHAALGRGVLATLVPAEAAPDLGASMIRL